MQYAAGFMDHDDGKPFHVYIRASDVITRAEHLETEQSALFGGIAREGERYEHALSQLEERVRAAI
jgi:hypothetical protein